MNLPEYMPDEPKHSLGKIRLPFSSDLLGSEAIVTLLYIGLSLRYHYLSQAQ
jgi:hypothetical protein